MSAQELQPARKLPSLSQDAEEICCAEACGEGSRMGRHALRSLHGGTRQRGTAWPRQRSRQQLFGPPELGRADGARGGARAGQTGARARIDRQRFNQSSGQCCSLSRNMDPGSTDQGASQGVVDGGDKCSLCEAGSLGAAAVCEHRGGPSSGGIGKKKHNHFKIEPFADLQLHPPSGSRILLKSSSCLESGRQPPRCFPRQTGGRGRPMGSSTPKPFQKLTTRNRG